jgi:pilus assembly protein CpaC
MRRAATIRAAAALAALLVASCIVPRALAGNVVFNTPPSQPIHVAASDYESEPMTLGISKSVVVDLPRDVKDVLVADPKIANAVVRSSRRVFIIGSTVGQTNVYFFDAEGKQIAGFDVAVTRDLDGIRQAIHQVLPDADITVEGIGDGVILSGSVSSPAESQQAFDIAARLLGAATSDVIPNGSKIVNAIVVRGRDQIMLKVVVAEVERDVIKQLGINLAGSFNYGTAVVNFNNTNPFSATGQSLSGSSITGGFSSVSATLQAMEQAGVIHTLAEPNLTAISGESATFVAGGEFPVLNGYSCSAAATGSSVQSCQPSIDFKKFGVSLNFTPIVLSEGRISLKVMTEVSDLSSQNSLTIAQPGSNLTATIPSIRTRRAETTVEIPSGGSLAMAGMIQNQTKQAINGLPGLAELPILGPLFKSRDYINQQTELMVLVTPYVVRAVAQKDLSRPDDGFADPSDPETILLGRFNRIYGVGGNPAPPDTYHGKYGFILD